jgi:calcium-translocating P-type ATPase
VRFPDGMDDGRSHPDWHALEAAEAAVRLDVDPHVGLAPEEAARRAELHGPNALEAEPERSSLDIALSQFRSPLIAILLVAGVVTVLLAEYVDAAVIAFVLAINATIGFVQERRADRSVHALMALASPTATVVRAGRPTRLDATALVPGDVVLLESGTRVPADLRLVATTALTVDESLLTGESLPARKDPGALPTATLAADRACVAHAGTTVASGRGRGVVIATGAGTELGRIAASIRAEVQPATPLQRRMKRFANIVAAAVMVTVVVTFVLGIALGLPADEMFLTGVALAVAVVPEGLPIALTVALALGVRRMAARNAIVRTLPAVETLGSTDVIGSDKTGTLTENRMTVVEVWTPDGAVHDPGDLPTTGPLLAAALRTAVLANEAELVRVDGGVEHRGDPTETALLEAAERAGMLVDPVRSSTRVLAAVPFEPTLQYAAVLVDEDGPVLRLKGAPERLVAACVAMAGPDGPGALDATAALAQAADMASRGLRVLATAERRIPADLPPEAAVEPRELVLTGLVGMQDPPRTGAREAVAACRRAGVRVVMITGDHAATALAIARDLGIADARHDGVLTGAELVDLDQAALRDRVRTVAVYARVAPDQKLAIVRALQDLGDVVAVTGDGVNDAPALRAADIGVAMGRSGTDVAREASDMVLTDDSFASIAAAVEEGRVVFDNVRKVTYFLVSTGVATIVSILTALVAGWPLPYVPAALLWLNVVTNGLDDVALAFDPAEPDVLERPPRGHAEPIVTPVLWVRSILVGLVMAVGSLWVFRWSDAAGLPLDQQRGAALTTLVIAMAVHTLSVRSERRLLLAVDPRTNPLLMAAIVLPTMVHVGALSWGPTRTMLQVGPVTGDGWTRIALIGLATMVTSDLHKLWCRAAERRRAARRTALEGAWA